jgi:hypothetical protein
MKRLVCCCAVFVTVLLGGEMASIVDKQIPAEPDIRLFDTKELLHWLRGNRPQRELSQWHVHHTWDPCYADFTFSNHLQLQDEMRKLHVDGNGWDDIGQHLTLFPDGIWMMGRSLEWDPASIRGWNRGAVALEMVGNFDNGRDDMTPMQWEALVQMTRFMIMEWGLEMRFHREHPDSGKTCPGETVDKEQLVLEVKRLDGESVRE